MREITFLYIYPHFLELTMNMKQKFDTIFGKTICVGLYFTSINFQMEKKLAPKCCMFLLKETTTKILFYCHDNFR